MTSIPSLLEISASRHSHLCPRQVLGVRMGVYAGKLLGITLPQNKKRLLTIVETDGCFVDGIEGATGCTVGHRTLRVEDYGKIAGVFVDTKNEFALRLAPALKVRELATLFTPHQKKRYFSQLEGYKVMPAETLFTVEEVQLTTPISSIISRAGVRVNCDSCGEEIINEREILQDGLALCRGCVGPAYYRPKSKLYAPDLQFADPAWLFSQIPETLA